MMAEIPLSIPLKLKTTTYAKIESTAIEQADGRRVVTITQPKYHRYQQELLELDYIVRCVNAHQALSKLAEGTVSIRTQAGEGRIMRYSASYHDGFANEHWRVYDGECPIARVGSYEDADRIAKMLNAYGDLVHAAEAVAACGRCCAIVVGADECPVRGLREHAQDALKLAKGE